MSRLAIELNDAGIAVAGDTKSVEVWSPGYALVDGRDLRVGTEAKRMSRLKPRWVNHQFWDQLGPDPMPKPFPRGLSRADVAHAHLTHLWDRVQNETSTGRDPSVLLAVPGTFSTDQLGLILGVARASEIPVTGMIDAALAAASTRPYGERILHLDATLHRMIWTELLHDGELLRRRVEVLDNGGLIAFWDAWAKRIASLLIRQTRFDPFHHGSADQTLYDQLPTWLAQLADSGSALVTLESEGKEHSVELTPDSGSGILETVLGPVVELARSLAGMEPEAVLMVSHRAAVLPGLLPRLAELAGATGVVALEESASVQGTLEHAERIEAPGSDLPFVMRLPVEMEEPARTEEATPPPVVSGPSGRPVAPTHLLLDGVAHPITSEPLWVGSTPASEDRDLELGGPMPGLSRRHCAVRLQEATVIVEDHSSFGTFLNGRRIEGVAAVAVGDRLRLGSPGVELVLIQVVEDDV